MPSGLVTHGERYKQMVLWDFPTETRLGFRVAFYMPVAVPRLAEVFVGTGYMQSNTRKRAHDTGIIMREIICAGVDSDVGRRLVGHMDQAHRNLGLQDPDMAQVLRCLVVLPCRMIDLFGVRQTTAEERTASIEFYRELGAAMGIDELPESYELCSADLDRYTANEVAPSPAARDITDAIMQVLRQRAPVWSRPMVGPLMASLVEPRVRDAVGLHAPPGFGAIIAAGAFIRRQKAKRRTPRAVPDFVPGAPNAMYPNGYTLGDLGKDAAL